MKTRKFYPRSTIKRLDGRDTSSLTAGERSSLIFAMRHFKRIRVSVSCTPAENPGSKDATPEEVEAAPAHQNFKIRIKA